MLPEYIRIQIVKDERVPLEAHYFKDRKGRFRRAEVAFTDGRMVARSWHTSGNTITLKPVPLAAQKQLIQMNADEFDAKLMAFNEAFPPLPSASDE